MIKWTAKKMWLVVIAIVVIGILVIAIGKNKKEHQSIASFRGDNREVYLLNDKESYRNPICTIGVDIEEADKFASDALSVELTQDIQLDKVLEQSTDLLQLIYNISVVPFESMEWQTLFESLNEWEGVSYISIVANKEDQTKQLEVFNQLKELISLQGYTGIELVYFINDEESLVAMKTSEVEYVGFNIHTKLDLLLLDELYDSLPNDQVSIVINDYLGNQGIELKQVLNEIQAFYYAIPIAYNNINLVFNQTQWGKSPDKVQNLYKEIYQKPWLTTNQNITSETAYKPVETINTDTKGIIELLTWANSEEIAYVEYKLNNQQTERVTRFPYILELETKELLDGLNKLNVSLYSKDGAKIDAKDTYLQINNNKVLKEKAKRSSDGYTLAEQPGYARNYIPVLMYHEFKQTVPEEETSITVGTQLFEEQLKALLEEGYTTINFLDLYNYLKGVGGLPEKPIIITTDDGYLSNYTEAFPILQKYNAQATFFITTQYVGVDIGFDHFTWDQAKEMEESGLIDIQSHTHEHRLLDETYKEDVLYQVDRSFSIIEEELGKRDVKALAYPQFRHNKETVSSLASIGIDLQITNLAKLIGRTTQLDVQRIHVSNDMTPQDLVAKLEKLTY